MALPSVAIFILHYKNSDDTLVCLNSALNQNFETYSIYIVDNFSDDGTFGVIEEYLSRFSSCRSDVPSTDPDVGSSAAFQMNGIKIFLFQSVKNGGFAYGHNLGVRCAKAIENYDYYLFLNNDLVLPSNTIEKFVATNLIISKNKPLGLMAARLVYLDRPDIVQAIGGRFSTFSGRSGHIGSGLHRDSLVEDQLDIVDYPVGACLFISSTSFECVGEFSEEYFLYYEELDYVERSKRLGFHFEVLKDLYVQHKEGGSAGSSSVNYKSVSVFSDYYLLRSRLKFMKKYYLRNIYIWLPVHIGNIFRRLLRGEFLKSINAVLAALEIIK